MPENIPPLAFSVAVVITQNPSSPREQILIFGGRANGYHNDVVHFNPGSTHLHLTTFIYVFRETKVFKKLEATGSVPTPRYIKTGNIVSTQLYLDMACQELHIKMKCTYLEDLIIQVNYTTIAINLTSVLWLIYLLN